jgi:hypothetical protein
MKSWIRLTLITVTVGGGFAGIAVTFQSLFDSSGASALNLTLKVGFVGLYVFVVGAGLLFVHDPTRTSPLLASLAIQIPQISSLVIVYKFTAGLEASFSVAGLENGNTNLNWSLLFGSSWSFAILQQNPLRVGVNLAALASLILLLLALRQTSTLTSPNKESVGYGSPTQIL